MIQDDIRQLTAYGIKIRLVLKEDEIYTINLSKPEKEIGLASLQVLEDAGVYKTTPEGQEAFDRFIRSL